MQIDSTNEIESKIEALRQATPEEAERLALDLANYGSRARGAIPHLIQRLPTASVSLAHALLSAIREIGVGEYHSWPEEFWELLHHPEASLRHGACVVLSCWRSIPLDKKILDRVLALLDDEDSTVRYVAARVLQTTSFDEIQQIFAGTPTQASSWLDRAENSDPLQRAVAAVALGRLPTETLIALEKLSHDDSPMVRRAAVIGLSSLRLAAVEPLTRLLPDPDPDIRQLVIEALGLIGERRLRSLIKPALKDADPLVRMQTIHALTNPLTPLRAPVLELEHALFDPDFMVQLAAVQALGWMGPYSHDAVPYLLQVLEDPDEQLAGEAAHALGNIGFAALVAVPRLTQHFLHWWRPEMAWRAGAALCSLAPFVQDCRSFADAILPGIDHADREVRHLTARALASLRDKDTTVLSTLAHAAIHDPDPEIRFECMDAFRYVPLLTDNIKHAAIAGLQDNSAVVRRVAAGLVAQFGQINPHIRQLLERALDDPELEVRLTAAESLVELNAGSPALVPVLLGAYLDSSSLHRRRSVQLLGQLPPTPEAQQLLNKALDDPEEKVREAAAFTLEQLRKQGNDDK